METPPSTPPVDAAPSPGAPLRVCLISSNLHAVPSRTYGAVEVQMIEQARGLVSLGHEVHVVTVGDDDPDADESITFHRLGPALADQPETPGLAGLVADQVRFGRRAKTLVRELAPDVVHYHARVPCLIGVTGRRPLTDRFPVLYHAHTWKRGAGMKYPLLSPRRAAYVVGSSFDRRAAEGSDHVIAISRFVRDRIIESTKAKGDRATVVTNVVDAGLFRRADVARNPHEILFVGRVAEEKGVHMLIEAMPAILRRVPDATLTIVGPRAEGTERGAYVQRCESLVERLGLGAAVAFAGMVPNHELPAVLSRARMLALPSRWEGLGVVVLEALACGLPVIGSRIGGIPELIDEGRTGRLVPAYDTGAWADAIAGALEDDALAETAATEGPALVAKSHTREAVRHLLDRVYRRALAARGDGPPTVAGPVRDETADNDASGRRIRVLLLLTSTAGGAGLQNYLLAKHLSRDEFDLTVAYGPGYPLDDAFAKLDVPIEVLPMSRKVAPHVNARGYLAIRRLLRRERFDVVCTSCSIAGLMGRVAAARTHVGGIMHVIHVYASQPHQHPAKVRGYRWLERRLDAVTRRYVAVSNAAKQYGVETGIMPADKVEVIFNAVEPAAQHRRPRDEVRRELGLALDAPVIGTVGRCERQKGMPYFLEAAAGVRERYPDARFLIVGDGPLQDELEAYARKLGIDDATLFLGWRDDVPDLLGAMDVFCLASLWETFGLVLAEAMEAGLTVVATRVDGVPEVVADGETGILVPPMDVPAMVHALDRVLGDADLDRKMGKAGARRLAEVFSVQEMVRSYEAVFRELVRAEGGLSPQR